MAIDQAETIIRNEVTESFNTLKLQLESEIDMLSDDLIADFALLQSQVFTLIAGKADKTYVDAQLNEIENDVTDATKNLRDLDSGKNYRYILEVYQGKPRLKIEEVI